MSCLETTSAELRWEFDLNFSRESGFWMHKRVKPGTPSCETESCPESLKGLHLQLATEWGGDRTYDGTMNFALVQKRQLFSLCYKYMPRDTNFLVTKHGCTSLPRWFCGRFPVNKRDGVKPLEQWVKMKTFQSVRKIPAIPATAVLTLRKTHVHKPTNWQRHMRTLA